MDSAVDYIGLGRMAVQLVRARAEVQDEDALGRYNSGILTEAIQSVVGDLDPDSPVATNAAVLVDHLAHFASTFIWAWAQSAEDASGHHVDDDDWLQTVMDEMGSAFLEGLSRAL